MFKKVVSFKPSIFAIIVNFVPFLFGLIAIFIGVTPILSRYEKMKFDKSQYEKLYEGDTIKIVVKPEDYSFYHVILD